MKKHDHSTQPANDIEVDSTLRRIVDKQIGIRTTTVFRDEYKACPTRLRPSSNWILHQTGSEFGSHTVELHNLRN